MNKKGFTLVELLAVIVILAIILAIAVPAITGITNNTKISAFENDAKMLIKAIDYKKISDPSFDPTTINESNVESVLNVGDDNYDDLVITVEDGKITVSITGKGKWDGLTATGNYNSVAVNNTVSDSITKTYLVNNGADDGWTELIGTEDFYNDYQYTWVGYLGGYRNLWIKWNNIDIPKGSVITSAKIQYKIYTGDWAYLDSDCETALYFNDVDNAVAPTTYADSEGKVFTTNNVIWNIPETASDTWIDSPDISSVIQEIVDRAGWNSGNSMMLLHRRHTTNTLNLHARIFHTYESGAANAPKLVITYN